MPLTFTLADIVETVAVALQLSEAKYRAGIERAVKQAWAYLAVADDWYFMREPTAYQIALNTTDTDYEIAQDEVGYMLYIADSNGKELAYYRDWYDAKRRRTDYGADDVPVLFEIAGIKNAHYLIRFNQEWDTAQTGYLYYNKAGSEANVSLLPAPWAWVLIHKAKSLVAPPLEIKDGLWQALTKNELFLFELGLEEMKRRCLPSPFVHRDDDMNPDYKSEIAEAEI